MSRLALFLLAPPRVELDGEPIHIGRRKVLALLAYMAMTKVRYRRETLAAFLAPEFDPVGARADLRRTLSLLNGVLGAGWLVVDRETVGLNPEAGPSMDSGQVLWLDVDQFRHRLASCEAHGHPLSETCPDCVPLLEQAAALYQGDFMAGFSLPDSLAFEEWHRFEAETLRQELACALERLVRGFSTQGRYESAVPHARRWLGLDLTHEPAHRYLMELHARTGQTAAAVQQYRLCESTLAEELALPPSVETTALYERILAGEIVAPAQAAQPPHNLPIQPTPFVGREIELAEIEARLEDPGCRLLTLVGVGGCGKTRLALEAAARQIQRYPHGVFFVSLAPLNSAASIVPTVADALGFTFYKEGEPQQQLLDYLRAKTMLLILDNYEHLLEGAGLVTEILATAPKVKVLATSRARLNVGGEHRYQVSGMHYPVSETPIRERDQALQYSAIKLFLQGARRAKQGFELTRENMSGVVQICRLVEGMPLAIRLAAPWVAALSPQAIAAELTRSLDILAADRRDVPERQRSVRASLDHTWRLINERERELMQALSIFRGGFTREAAQQVTAASLHELMALVDKSLVPHSPAGRYEIHELLRQYAEEKLAASPKAAAVARDGHCAYYAAAAERWSSELKGPQQMTALAEMRADHENVSAAWRWAVERGDVARLDQAFEGLCLFYDWRGRYREGEAACRSAANVLRAHKSVDEMLVLVKLLVQQSAFGRILGLGERASQLLQESLDLLNGPEFADRDTQAEHAAVLKEMGHLARYWGDLEDAMRRCEQSLALFRSLGDVWEVANILGNMGGVARHLCYFDKAKKCFEECLALRRSAGDRRGTADALIGLSDVLAHSGHVEEGERLAREGIGIHREMRNRVGVTNGLYHLAARLEICGKFAEACPLLEEAAVTYNDLGMRSRFGAAQNLLAWAKTNLGLYDEARALLQMYLELCQELGQEQNIGMCFLGLGDIALAQEAYVEARQLLEEGVALLRTPEHEGLALASVALAARALGQTPQAQGHIRQALRLAVETGAMPTSLSALSAAALFLADGGECERAVELYALVTRHPYYGNSRFQEDVAGKHIMAAAADLRPDVVAAAQERGRVRDLNVTVKDLLAEFEVNRTN